jgi:Ca2+-binding EF-hand superfamily protein
MKVLILVFCSLCIFSLSAQNEPLEAYDSWDGNRDGVVTDEEFNTIWDREDYWGNWDTDDDGVLNEEEWRESVDTYYSETVDWEMNENRDFSRWDMDDDGFVNETEFRDGNFNTWDANSDGRVIEEEYYNYSNTLGDNRRY